MDALSLEHVVGNFNVRFDRIEQILPILATKAELREGLQSVKDELRAEFRADGAETRRYMKMLVEDLRDDIRILAEGLVALDARDARQHAESAKADAHLDVRVAALEAGRRRRRSH